MRTYLLLLPLLLALLLGARPAHAKITLVAPAPTAAPAPAPPDTVAATDTVAALHRLFARKRQARTRTVLLTLVGGGILTAASLDSGPLPPATNAAFGVAETGLALVVEILLYSQYDRPHEQRAVAALAAHRLPASIRRKLHPGYFAPPAS